MMKEYMYAGLVVLLTLLILTGCGQTPDASNEDLQITVSIVPQIYFVERIGGELVNVNVMVLPGQNPATYEPKPAQLKALSDADAYVSIGVPFENAWLSRIRAANTSMTIIDTTRGIERMPISAHDHHDDDEEEHAEEEAEGNPDPHIWLSPALVKVQAQTIYEGLVELDPEHEAEYQQNLEAFLQDIEALEADIRRTLEGVENRKFMVFHPSWGYFARDFDLEMIAVEVGGQEPSASELAALIEEAEEEGIQVVFAQPEFSTRAAETIANEIGGEVLLISPLAEDWLDNLLRVANAFAEAL